MSEYFPKNTGSDLNDLWIPESENPSNDYDSLNDNSDIQVALRDGDYAGIYWDEERATAFEDLYGKDPLDIHSDRE